MAAHQVAPVWTGARRRPAQAVTMPPRHASPQQKFLALTCHLWTALFIAAGPGYLIELSPAVGVGEREDEELWVHTTGSKIRKQHPASPHTRSLKLFTSGSSGSVLLHKTLPHEGECFS